MDLIKLKCFKEVVEQGSILKASYKLNISQPPLSRMMKQLETELNTTLFIRGRQIALTNTGKLLYERACLILSLTDNTIKEINEVESNNEITLNIGIVSSSTELLYKNNIERFNKIYPNARFNIIEANTYILIEQLNHKLIDLAVVRTPFNLDSFNHILFKSEPMIVLNKKQTLPVKINIANLTNQPLIIYRRFKNILINIFKEHEINLNIIAEVDDAKTAILLAKTGIGMAVVPQSAYSIFTHLNLYPSIIDNDQLKTQLGVIYPKKAKLNQIYLDFINILNS